MKVIEQINQPIDKNHTEYVFWSQHKKLKNINRKSQIFIEMYFKLEFYNEIIKYLR